MGRSPTPHELAALRRCFERARGCSGGESRVRRVLFAWHNAAELGALDLAELWLLSPKLLEDVLTVIAMVARGPQGWYAHEYGFGDEMRELVEMYTPKPPL